VAGLLIQIKRLFCLSFCLTELTAPAIALLTNWGRFGLRMAMAGINKLSVEKVLNKIRSADAPAPKFKTASLEKKLDAALEEVERLRAATRRLRPGKPAGRSKHD
jgi:hypothetical protein